MTRTTSVMGGGAIIAKGERSDPAAWACDAPPNGDIIATNAGNGNMVEITPAGKQVVVRTADPKSGDGSLFGLVVNGKGVYFVDDGDNTLRLFHWSPARPYNPPSHQPGGSMKKPAALLALPDDAKGRSVAVSCKEIGFMVP